MQRAEMPIGTCRYLVPADQIALINMVPEEDQMEEIILGGVVVCAIQYLPEERH